jgi:dTDP-4-dehydrorhamnose reductase
MRLLVFGQTGQVARELARRAPFGVTVTTLNRAQADLSNPDVCAAAVLSAQTDAVINAAAFTAVDRAETDTSLAQVINAESPGAIARACAIRGLPFLHLSSDYVFDGAGERPFRPDDTPAPVSAYGRSKRDGEAAVLAASGHSLILRTSWVFSPHGSNFVKTMLKLGKDRQTLSVVADQVGGPTPAAAIADAVFAATRQMCDGAEGGIHHYAGQPDISWADFARAVMAEAGLQCRIIDIRTENYPTPAQRPHNSRLDCSSFVAQFGVERPDWRQGLRDVVAEMGAV